MALTFMIEIKIQIITFHIVRDKEHDDSHKSYYKNADSHMYQKFKTLHKTKEQKVWAEWFVSVIRQKSTPVHGGWP